MSQDDKYNLVVIGAGAAGLVSSIVGATVKARVALIEEEKMGGDCLNTGCVPSKAIIKAAKVAHTVKEAARYGIGSGTHDVRFASVMEKVHGAIKAIEPHDSIERYEGLGVECFQGRAEIVDRHTVQVGDKTLKTRAIILAMGAAPFVPPIPGLAESRHYTSETIWSLTELPKKVVVLGGGAIGCELAQSLARLGSQVTLMEMAPRIFAREDPDVSELMTRLLRQDGLQILVGTRATQVVNTESGGTIQAEGPEGPVEVGFDAIVCALGRAARTQQLQGNQLGVKLQANGTIAVDRGMKAAPGIYAAGDIVGPYQFTHMASFQAYFAAVNALFPVSLKANYDNVPWVTFTDPEVARVGASEDELKQRGIPYELATYDLSDSDRAITESKTEGFIKVCVRPGSKRGDILGATIVAERAGDMNIEFMMAKKYGLGLQGILSMTHAYPTWVEANRFAAADWKKKQTKPWVFSVLEKYHRWRR